MDDDGDNDYDNDVEEEEEMDIGDLKEWGEQQMKKVKKDTLVVAEVYQSYILWKVPYYGISKAL